MQYQKIINLLDNTPNQPTKFGAKCWVEINDDKYGTHSTNSQIKFKTSNIVKGTITVPKAGTPENPSNRKNIISKNCALFDDCTSEINNTQIQNAKTY